MPPQDSDPHHGLKVSALPYLTYLSEGDLRRVPGSRGLHDFKQDLKMSAVPNQAISRRLVRNVLS